jgi:hypothetical protein
MHVKELHLLTNSPGILRERAKGELHFGKVWKEQDSQGDGK